MTNHQNRCTFHYHSINTLTTQGQDTQCIFEKGHLGEHRYREILPPPQQYQKPMSGWVNHEQQ